MKKFYSQDELMDKFEGLSYKKKYEILYSALGIMQQYNGRPTDEFILLAMGYEHYSDSMYQKESKI